MSTPAIAHPSATLVLLRDGEGDELEILLARRRGQLSFHGGAWVFPGGRVEPTDRSDGADEVATARRAAVRETCEEVGLAPSGEPIWFAHWTTPVDAPKRFATWFFAARAATGAAQADGGEMEALRWLRPSTALAAQRAGELELPPATFVTLSTLAALGTVDAVLATLAARPPERYLPRTVSLTDGRCSLYQGDAGYDDADLDRAGARHRLWMRSGDWRYERRD